MHGRTHMPFALALSAAAVTAICHIPSLQDTIPVYTGASVLSNAAHIVLTLGCAYITGPVPDIDKKIAVGEHRGITHAIWIPALLFYLACYKFRADTYLFCALFGIFLGYISHLLSDAFSKAGVAWFYPIQQYKRYDNGAFVVKGFRGPFIPIYSVKEKPSFIMPVIWYLIAGLVVAVLARKVFGL